MELLHCTGYVYKYVHEKRNPVAPIKIKKYLCSPTNQEPCLPGYGCVTQFKFLKMEEVDRKPSDTDIWKIECSVTEAQFNKWLLGITDAYPSIKTISLIGSRARGQGQPGSDWDVLISLEESCYRTNKPHYNRDFERMITYDQLSSNTLIDIWFLRPNGIVARDARKNIKKDFFDLPGFRLNDPAITCDQLVSNSLIDISSLLPNGIVASNVSKTHSRAFFDTPGFRLKDPVHSVRIEAYMKALIKDGVYCQGRWDDLYLDIKNAVLLYKRK